MFFDITKELFASEVYPGDTRPERRAAAAYAEHGYSLTDVTLCSHNGTHVDAPSHFIEGGKTAEQIDLARTCGACAVVSVRGEVTPELLSSYSVPRILLHGECEITPRAAEWIRKNLLLVGTDMLSVGDERVHKILLSAEVAVLEGLELCGVPNGIYRLIAFPVKWGGCDGAPVRAVLYDDSEDPAR